MLDALVKSEREPDVVELSGGEPTIHPDFFAVVEAAKARPIRHLMVNTNGIRLAKEPDLAPLYEIGFDLLLFMALFALRDRLRVRGNLFRLYLFAYATFRLGLEMVRGDSPFPAIGGPKPIQILLAIAAVRYAVLLWRQEIGPRTVSATS